MTRLYLSPIARTGFILFIFFLVCLKSYTQTNTAEQILSIPDYTGNAKELLEKIQESNEIIFAYSSELPLDFKVSFQKGQMTLAKFLAELFDESEIDYKVKSKKVQLYKRKNETPNKTGDLTQTVRGIIIDHDSRLPLFGATVAIMNSDPFIGTVSDIDGKFRMENIPIGRMNIQLSYVGYENVILPNIEVNSGKEVILTIEMREAAMQLNEVVVSSSKRKGQAINDLSILSSRSITLEETKRYSGGMDDPARMVTSYAGVNSSNGSSDIIVRGNSPKYMQWRLDGVEITSPYHMNDQNAAFGALTALNKSLLSTYDFYTGAFSPEYGNVLSNVMDVKLRNGNNENFESTFGVGLMGIDFTAEGPFKKGYSGSYLVNYRYSTISLLTDIGLLEDVEGAINYQDATFKFMLPTKNAGTFSVFGLWGKSGINATGITPEGISTPGGITDASITKDYDKDANLANVGVSHTITLSKKSYLSSSLSLSTNGYKDDLWNVKDTNIRKHTFKSRITNSAYRAKITYNRRINNKNKIQIGTRYAINMFDYKQDIYNTDIEGLYNVTNFRNNVNTINNFISWRYSPTENVNFILGLHNMNVLLNTKSTIEPRLAMNWSITPSFTMHMGYGKHSTAEKAHNYFTKIPQPDGSFSEPNRNLDMLMADHYVFGLEKRFNENLVAKAEFYYQHLYNLPVENNDTSYYSTINEGINYTYVPLVNEGVGRNYGLELTLERYFDNNYYFMLNGSIYDSKYKSLEGKWRNTLYNGNYLFNFLCGKEFNRIGKKKTNVLAINLKANVGGAQRYIPLLRDADGNVAVDPENNQYWDYSRAYDNDLVHVYNVNVSFSYKINRAKSTHELFLDLMNVINSKANLSEYYDASQPDKIGYNKQMTFLPNIMYRVYF